MSKAWSVDAMMSFLATFSLFIKLCSLSTHSHLLRSALDTQLGILSVLAAHRGNNWTRPCSLQLSEKQSYIKEWQTWWACLCVCHNRSRITPQLAFKDINAIQNQKVWNYDSRLWVRFYTTVSINKKLYKVTYISDTTWSAILVSFAPSTETVW